MQLPKCLNPNAGNSHWSPPVDVRDLAIRLETEGVSDSVAAGTFGFEDTWEMAETWFPKLPSHSGSHRTASPLLHKRGRNPLLDYLSGTSFALPLLFSCLAILLLKFSLWGGELPAHQTSAIAVGIAFSFIATGGFVQAMSRQGMWYIGTAQFRNCATSTLDWVRKGMAGVLALAVAGAMASNYFEWFPAPLYSLAAAFCLALSLLWLSAGALYMLGRNLMVAVATLLGIAGVIVIHLGMKVNLFTAQIVSIVFSALFALSVAVFLLRKQGRGDTAIARKEAGGRTLYYVWPYFVYGCIYYLFLFSDRLIAWTAHREFSGMAIQFRGSYEAGQDMALFAFVFQVGWVHSTTVRFYERLVACQRELPIERCAEFNRRMTRCYWRMTLPFVPLVVVTAAAVYTSAWAFGFFADPMRQRVMMWSLAGFLLLVLSLRNVSLLFALSSPGSVLWAIVGACAANLGTGYAVSRFGSYEQAIIGFALGSLVFSVISTWHSLQILRRLDYHYFASAV